MSKNEETKDLIVGQSFSLTNIPSQSGISLANEDISLPFLRIHQATSKGSFQQGRFVLNNVMEFETIQCIFFKNTLGRVLYNPNRSDTNNPLCGSSDRIRPSARFKEPIAKTCNDCKFNRPGSSEDVMVNGMLRRKECDMTLPVIGCIIETYMPFVFVARRTSATPMRQFLSTVAIQIEMMNKIKHKNYSLHNFVIEMSTKKIEQPERVYHVPQLKQIGQPIENDEFSAIFETVKDYNFDRALEVEVVDGNPIDPEMDSQKVI